MTSRPTTQMTAVPGGTRLLSAARTSIFPPRRGSGRSQTEHYIVACTASAAVLHRGGQHELARQLADAAARACAQLDNAASVDGATISDTAPLAGSTAVAGPDPRFLAGKAETWQLQPAGQR